MQAKPSPEVLAIKRDFDAFDEVCDHLLVLDRRRGDGPRASSAPIA
jgi:putative hemolysin